MLDRTYYAVTIAPDEKEFAAVNANGDMEIRNLNDGNILATIADATNRGNWITNIRYMADGKSLVVNLSEDGVCVYDRITLEKFRRIKPEKGAVISTALSADSKYLCILRANCPSDKKITLWTTSTWKQIRAFDVPADAINVYAMTAVFSPDNKYLLTEVTYDRVLLWDADSGTFVHHFDFTTCETHIAIAYAPDGQTVIAAQENIKLFRVNDGAIVHEAKTQIMPFTSAATFSPDSRFVYLCGNEVIKCWDISSGEFVWSTPAQQEIFYTDLALTTDGLKLLVAGTNGHLLLLDTQSRKPIWSIST